jgi:hypothetical protein
MFEYNSRRAKDLAGRAQSLEREAMCLEGAWQLNGLQAWYDPLFPVDPQAVSLMNEAGMLSQRADLVEILEGIPLVGKYLSRIV